MKKDFQSAAAFLGVLRVQSAKLPGAEEYVMVHHPAFRVGKKPFVIVGMDDEGGKNPTLSINLGPERQPELLDDPRFERTPYIGQHGWVTVRVRDLTANETSSLVEQSYRRIAGKKWLLVLDGSTKAAPKVPKKSAVSTTAPRASKTAPKKKTAPKTSTEKARSSKAIPKTTSSARRSSTSRK